MKATYLLIKSSVLSVTDQRFPIQPSANAEMASNGRCWDKYQKQYEAFCDSFIRVDNHEALDKFNFGLPIGFIGADAIYAAPEGIEFEVKEEVNCGGDSWLPIEKVKFNPPYELRKVAVVSLVEAKESEPEKKKYTIEEVTEKLKEGLSEFGCKSTVAGKWVLEDNVYHVLRNLGNP